VPLDPFTQVHDAIWTMLEAHAGFTALVPRGNRIKFSDSARNATLEKVPNRDPMKEKVQAGDLPEVRVVFASIDRGEGQSSNHETFWVRWEIHVASGDQRLTAILFPLVFEVFRAMHGWQSVLGALTWSGTRLVKNFRTGSVRIGVTDADLNRNIQGWSAVWAAEALMVFALTAVQPVP
jgi:hypothetical protein